MSIGQDPPHIPLQKNDSLVLTAVLQDDKGAPIAITSADLTVREGGLTTTPVVYAGTADLSQAALGIAIFAIPPNTLATPGRCLASVILRQGTVIQQTGALVIDVLDHA